MIDSHCHLDHEPIYSNLDNILNRSKALGIEKLLTICTTDDGFKNILNLIAKDPIIYGTYGIHPHETSNNKVSKEIIFQKVKSNKKIIGVGETGFDFYYTNSDKLSQTRSFTNHIEASIELSVPIIIHSRNAENETFDILSNYKKYEPKILMHCYTGSEDFAKNLERDLGNMKKNEREISAKINSLGIKTLNNTMQKIDNFLVNEII